MTFLLSGETNAAKRSLPMNNSLVRWTAVALALFAGLSLLFGDGVVANGRARSDSIRPFVTSSMNQPDITLCLAEDVALEFAGNVQEGVAAGNYPPTSDGVPPSCIQNRLGIWPMGIATGLAPPGLESI